MARMARAVAAGLPHLVTQRGNRGEQVFFGTRDYATYKEFVAEHCSLAGVDVLAWCLMPNHVHLLLLPETEDGLQLGLGEAHRRYTRYINARNGWTGHLWQARFASFTMDDTYLPLAIRYVELNPVRAKLVNQPEQWQWSSAKAHLAGAGDGLTTDAAILAGILSWPELLAEETDEGAYERIRLASRTGRPLGSPEFLDNLEATLGRRLRPGKPGPKSKLHPI